ncbi:MAG: hypothetical protein ACPHCJ_08365 [Oceanococcaceae bacterium]
MRSPILALLLASLLIGCGDQSDSSSPAPTEERVEAGSKTVYSFANACYTLSTPAGYVQADASNLGLVSNPSAATAFYFKPTRLGAYLLLSAYERAPGEAGSKQLLGISDPGGEFLDAAGNFVGEVSYLVSGIGDMSDYFLDLVAPGNGVIREAGELIGDGGERLGDTNVVPALAVVEAASDLAVWALLPAGNGNFHLIADVSGQYLAAADDGSLGLTAAPLAALDTAFTLNPAEGCTEYPEVPLNLSLLDPQGPAKYLQEVPLFSEGPAAAQLDEDDVFGFIDAHAHITAYEFIGGRVNYGDPFHKFGVDHALDECSEHHGPQGILGLVETATSGHGQPYHETQGWPDFPFWPRHNSLQHHQSYYRWLERAHLAGLKILVNHFTGSEILCQLNPQKEDACDFEENWRLQAQRAHEMQDYIDAQHGGPGQGWMRIVDNPVDARRVIDEGKMAVVFGIEISKLFNCGEFLDQPDCTFDQMRERLDAAYRAGVRHIFPVHKFDSAFGGVVPDEGFGNGTIIYAGNLGETGHLLEFEECPDNFDNPSHEDPNAPNPLGIIDQMLLQLSFVSGQLERSPLGIPVPVPAPENGLCNIRGLTPLGHSLMAELMQKRMIIEVDHSSRKTIDRIFEIAEANGYPGVTSSHDWLNSEELLDRMAHNGGPINRFASARGSWVDRLNRVDSRMPKHLVGDVAGTGMASDVNGIASLPGNNGNADTPLYPFTSVDGRVQFDVQVTGDHAFNLYEGRGVAHYGLYPDQIADMQRFSEDKSTEEVERALRHLFSSAEAYLRMWERTEAWENGGRGLASSR